MTRKICVVTGSRAEYGLLFWLLKELQQDPAFELQLVITGAHLSADFGQTENNILADGFTPAKRVEIPFSDFSAQAISKEIGRGISGFADAFADLKPDLVLVLGDRYEIFAAVIAAHMAQIPVAHLHGGETTEGAVDEALRHSITKMAQLHFVAAEPYRKRVIQLGEQPENVFTVGAMAAANINRLPLLTKAAFEEAINFRLGKNNLLITYHPETLGQTAAAEQMQALLKAVDELPETKLIFTMPNADTGAGAIAELIKGYVAKCPKKSVLFTSMGQLLYLSAMQFVDGVVGNSSSGLIEAPAFKIGTLNIGDRQKGRLKASSVIDSAANYNSICKGLRKLNSPEFRQQLPSTQNPYGSEDPTEAILQILKRTDWSRLMKKSFFDIPFSL